MDYFKHESAYVDEGAKVGRGTRIWHFCHVMAGAEIGENCTLGQNVFVAKGVRIGNGVKIQNNVSVYEGVVLEDDVFVGPSAVFTNVRNPRSPFPRNRPEDYLPTRVKRGATIGANATIVCGVTLGEWCFVAAGAVVTKDVPPYALLSGNPAKIYGVNIVGLRRNGLTPEVRMEIQRAYKILYRSGLNVSQAIEEMERQLSGTEEVEHILRFLRNAERGICR